MLRKQRPGFVGNVFKSILPIAVSSTPTLTNRSMNVLPLELQLPWYKFCGPETKLETKRGKYGINNLACRERDIVYVKYRDT